MKTAIIIKAYKGQIAKIDRYLETGKWVGSCPFCDSLEQGEGCEACYGPFEGCYAYKPKGSTLDYSEIDWRLDFPEDYTLAQLCAVKPWMQKARADLAARLKKIKADAKKDSVKKKRKS